MVERIAAILRKIEIRFLTRTVCAHIESLSSLSQYGLGARSRFILFIIVIHSIEITLSYDKNTP